MLIITFEINNVTEGRFVNRTHCYKFNDARILVAIFSPIFILHSKWQKDMFNQR